MKNLLRAAALAICAIFMAANVSAQVITAERASEIANQFFANGKQKSAAFRSTNATLTQSVDSHAITGESNDAPTFHILTGADGKGFVIVSGEETENPIIGYSFDGTIDTNNLPDGFVDYMTDIDAQVRALREYNAANPQKAAARSAMQKTNYNASMGNIIVLHETAKWGQGSPFNRLCFTDATHTTNAATGCVPTAFAIVMRYHKWPEEGIGRLVDFQLSTSELIYITDRTYDWDNMPLVYDGNWSDYQINEVAKVMRDLGHTYMVEYGQNNTGVSVPGSSGKLETYFNYNNISGVSQAQVGSIDDWKSRIRESLNNNCPIPYKSHNSASGDSNHMFVLDGYTDNDYFHFNWGWSGSGNGWFKLDNMQPLGSNYSWGASSDHMAIFNLTPKKTLRTVTASVSPAGAGSVTVNGNANTADVTEGTAATLEATANSGYTFSHWSKNGAQVSTEKTYKAVVAAEDNDYVANFLTVGNSRVNVSVTYNSNYGSVTYNSNAVQGTGITPYENSEVTLIATPLDDYVFNGWTVTKGTNTTNYAGTELTFVATEDMSVEARFSLAVSDYTISTSNITKSDYRQGSSSYCSTWTTADGIILSATKGSEKAYALSASNPLLYARATTESSTETAVNEITFTLTAPDGYILLSYDIFCYCNGSYTIDATPEGGNTITINRADDHTISASGINAKSARFVLSSSNGNAAIRFDNFTVRLQSEGGGSTPTPDPEPEPDPTTYNITAEASPQNAGKVAINGGTQSTVANIDATSGSTVSLQAYPNSGYEFAGWYNGTTKVSSDNPYSITATAAISYIASFQEVQQGGSSSDDLAGKYFRLKVYNDGRYMNVKNHTEHAQKVTAGGVNIAAKDEDSNAQIFFFEQSGNGYMLKDGDGYYIKGLEWSVDASSTTNGSVLLFEETAIEDVYYIKWNNTYKGDERYFKVGADSNGAGDHPYCDVAANQKETAAAKWVLEEVIPSLTVTFAGASWVNEASSWWEYIVTNQTPAVTVKAANSAKAIGYSTVSSVRHPYLLDGNSFTISLPANCKIVGYTLRYKGHNLNTKTFTYTGNNGTTATETVGQDGVEKTLTVTGLENNEIAISVSDQSSQAGVVIVALEITYVENEFTPLPFKAEIEGWRNDNPNTHLGTITIGGTQMKLTPEHLTASELTMPVVEGTTLAFTRKYRGFEFQGFYIGATELGTNPTLTADNVAAIDQNNPLVAKFTATDDVTLFYDDDQYSYRIPAIAKTGNGMLVAVSDYRHNLDDIGRDNHGTGTKRIDLVMRTSTDNGATWSDIKTIAAGDNSKTGSYLRAFGDAAIAAVGQNIVVMAAAGDVVYTAGTTSSPNKMARIYSSDNGATWAIEEMTTKMYSQNTSLIPSGGSAFFGSGKLAVDPNFNDTGNARIYGALLVRIGTDGYNNFGVFSDDLGATWKILGGDNTNPVAKGDEPKVEILPNGQILLSARRGGGRVFRVFTYGDDKANGAGSWGDAAVNGCDNGGSNATNGEIICLDAKKPNGKPTKILLQSQPKGGSGQYDRKDVTIWYKEVSADETYTSATIASGWTMGKQVSTVQSSYSAMCLQANGEIALFFEEAPCYADDYTKGYSMVYVPLTIEEITGENFLNPNAVVETVTVDVTLTDEQGNTYTHQFDYLPGDAAAIDAALMTAYPFITELGEGNLQGSDTYYTYTNTVTLPFKVSNANTTVWHNIYFPANGTSAGEYYPIYLMAENENATAVAKITEKVHYGNSQYNTYNYADKLAWAVYNVNEGFTFKFKNKLTGKFMAVTGVSSDNTNNVVYTDEAGATAFTLEKYTGGNASYGNYAIKSVYNSTTGYVCNTSVGYTYATNYPGTGHAGAWVKFVESPDYWTIYNQLIADIDNFGAGEGKYTANDAISSIDKDALATMPINSLNTQKENVQTVKDSYSEITLSIPVANSGSVKIKNEAVSNKFVQKGEVTIEAVPAAGYRFVNWTRPAAQASAAARTAEARNAVEVVSTDNPYTFNLTDAVSLEANFEEILVNVTLTDAQSNTYNVELSGFTSGVTKETVAAKLKEAYPYITLGLTDQEGNVIDFGVLNIDGTTYTYTNWVELPFKVSNAAYIWHNIYYPSNNTDGSKPGCPNYIAALNEDEVVDMAASAGYYYGDNPTYNTKAGNSKISWAIYNVNNSFEFIFKNALTNKYIKVESVVNATGNTQNVKFVENAEDATAFTLLKDAGSYNGDYALVAKVDDATGYLCATSSSTNYVTHFDRNNHQGAWVKIVETDYISKIMDLSIMLGYKFGAGDGMYIITDAISEINDRIANNSENITLNTIKQDSIVLNNAINSWPAVRLTINPVDGGTTNINGEAGVVHKYVPNDYELPLAAIPAEGYHFVSWTDGTSEIETTEYTKTISGGKGDVIELTANFAKNTYTINVSTNGTGGSASASAATVEHGNAVTLTATPSSDYSFAGWYDGEEFVSAEATYTFTVTSDINYTARFNEVPTGTVAIHITVASTDGTTVTNNATGNVKAIINNIGQEWATDDDFVVGADVELVATNDYDQKAYLFDGWYKNGVLVSNDLEITVQATEVATYEARFFRGCVVIGNSNNNRFGYVNSITLADGTSIGYDASNRAVVKAGTTVKINTWIEMYGYEVGSWTNVNDEVVGTDNSLIVQVNEDVTYTANFEPVSYNLTVRANDDSYGTVSAKSGTATGTTVKVGQNMEATITATAKAGYYFVNWTKGTDVVSSENPYTIPGIADIENMADAEYIANFLPVENATAGVYYRIAYDYTAPAAAGAARAAGDVTYTLTPKDGGMTSGSKTSEWISSEINSLAIRMVSTTANGDAIEGIQRYSDAVFKLMTSVTSPITTIKYTLSAPDGYIISNYSFQYNQRSANNITFRYDGNEINITNTTVYDLSVEPNKQTAEFTLTSSTFNQNAYLLVKNFTVTIQPVGGETPEPEPGTPSIERYYMQSVACEVSGANNLQNALKMTQETGAASIFYYADSKLLSYDKGTYIKEDGGTRGLQAVGTSGDVTITTADGISKIAAPSYLHAVINKGGTSYVDHCGSDNGDVLHNFVLDEVTSLPVTIGTALHATFYAPVAVAIPYGVKAYVLKEKNITAGSYVTMTLLGNGIIPANTGVILKSEEAKEYEFNLIDPEENIDDARAETVGNVLSGTVAKTKITEDAYILANREGKIGLYPVAKNSYLDNSTDETTVRFTNNSHKAYLPVKGNFAALLQQGVGFRFIFDDDATTEIEDVETENVDTIYDLQGRKLSEITEPGIYIVNGKKIFVK